ncbi:2-oxoacid:acceptor oxidoreductase subunit alpha [Alkalilimnicola ehrlichii MLHE-1]|uniref:Pyruvate flavodoxin/ferredoxin oxidoreductase domain protein n=1 Tax=Alkalilimnicola ehrlichii (strain ATCC BAA-1101 / DSM 17681 / MLHE-1) TaxID=187272 RepID=Q0AAT6_ALKEH|nr:2-oxoacid:acceptor oxidoreductase subunit alpha [Alkalilimnicola ehrlichii]ABI56051.1 pyruvate flavodoxin/ferredoxin oxidoreductase domain protein [Alkalilimnicola ehrlichii MLHE-1]
MKTHSLSLALTGSGGTGVMTAGQILLDAAAQAGWYGLMTRSFGPQIRGGEAAAILRLAHQPVGCQDDQLDLLLAFDWGNIERFIAELPLGGDSVVIADPSQGDVPEVVVRTGASQSMIPIKEVTKGVKGGRANMVGLGLVAELIGLPEEALLRTLQKVLGRKGEEALATAQACLSAGRAQADTVGVDLRLASNGTAQGERWALSGNEAAGMGAVRGGVRFSAAYPITPSTDVVEWLAPTLPRVGGCLVQAEDELSAINMCIGASFGGTPALTATSGPGLSLMVESLGLAVASETPVVVVNVMRGGPSTGIPTKSEQADLNIALYGLHGDAPHLVVAANGIADCLAATQWAVHLAEALQSPAIVLSDQALGQARAVIDRPQRVDYRAQRKTADRPGEGYLRYAITEDGVSPMAIPGTPCGEYTADGLEHAERGTPSTQASHHQAQLDKRLRKLTGHDYGAYWADIEGDGELAVITWGSSTSPVREALERAQAEGITARMVSVRLLSPAQPEALAAALDGVSRLLVVEQSHDGQFHRYLRAHYDLPGTVRAFHHPGPLPIRPGEVLEQLRQLAQQEAA